MVSGQDGAEKQNLSNFGIEILDSVSGLGSGAYQQAQLDRQLGGLLVCPTGIRFLNEAHQASPSEHAEPFFWPRIAACWLNNQEEGLEILCQNLAIVLLSIVVRRCCFRQRQE